MSVKEITRLDQIRDYKYHPRILEIRLIGIYNILVKEYGPHRANDALENLCSITNQPYSVIYNVVSKANRIQHSVYVTKHRYTQEMIVMGELWGETRYVVATKFLNLKNYNYLYQDRTKHNLEYFATGEWLAQLDEEVTVAGVDSIKTVVANFLDELEIFLNLF